MYQYVAVVFNYLLLVPTLWNILGITSFYWKDIKVSHKPFFLYYGKFFDVTLLFLRVKLC
jgi:hypothetical protein